MLSSCIHNDLHTCRHAQQHFSKFKNTKVEDTGKVGQGHKEVFNIMLDHRQKVKRIQWKRSDYRRSDQKAGVHLFVCRSVWLYLQVLTMYVWWCRLLTNGCVREKAEKRRKTPCPHAVNTFIVWRICRCKDRQTDVKISSTRCEKEKERKRGIKS